MFKKTNNTGRSGRDASKRPRRESSSATSPQSSSTYTIKRVIGSYVPEGKSGSFSISNDGRLVTPEDRGGYRKEYSGRAQKTSSTSPTSSRGYESSSRGGGGYSNSSHSSSGYSSDRRGGGSSSYGGGRSSYSSGGGQSRGYSSGGNSGGYSPRGYTGSSYSSGGGYSSGGQSGGYQRRPYSGGGNRGNSWGPSKRRYGAQNIDINKFINKAPLDHASLAHIEFVPKHTFKDFKIDEKLKENVLQKGYALPTPIQDKAIPEVLEGKDVSGLANTGTGKTAAFLIPLVDKAIKNKEEQILIVVPTRELAIQIEDELRGFAKGLGLYGVVCVGGTSISTQIRSLKYHNNFVIGTPGRLKDLIERNVLDLSLAKTVVLDEADRMLDMGFIHDIRAMMAMMSKDRQTLFFSATITKEIEGLISTFLKNPVHISVRTGDTAKSVYQDVIRIDGATSKIDVLTELLKKEEFEKVLVFGNTKHGVERLARELKTRGITTESIHGDKNQASRQKSLSLFKTNQVKVLVATDVAARGLDISSVSHVINFDLPATYEDYVHRIGRTGRGGKTGIALTFV